MSSIYLSAAERKRLKEERRAENKRKWAEQQAESKENKTPIKSVQPIETRDGKRQRMQEIKEKLLAPVHTEMVIRKLFAIAGDDEHPGQMQALKLMADRIMPVSMFEDVKKSGGTPQISINITGIGENPVNIIEHEADDVDD